MTKIMDEASGKTGWGAPVAVGWNCTVLQASAPLSSSPLEHIDSGSSHNSSSMSSPNGSMSGVKLFELLAVLLLVVRRGR